MFFNEIQNNQYENFTKNKTTHLPLPKQDYQTLYFPCKTNHICIIFIKIYNLLKSILFFLLLTTFGQSISAQNFQLKIIGTSIIENKTIDSLQYISKHSSIKSISDEINKTSKKLTKIGFLENKTVENKKTNDSTYTVKFDLGKKTESIHIYIGINQITRNIISTNKENDTLIIPYKEIESFLDQTLKKIEQKGFALAKFKLINLKKNKNILYADLITDIDQKRHLNSIVTKFSENDIKDTFPKSHLKQINRKYKNTIFNQDLLKQIYNDFEKYRFISQLKYPEILLTKDTTKVYVYLEKRKSNTFDGFIGFANNENKKILFNGYLDIQLENILHTGEQFSIYWKSDGNKQKTFKAGIEIPYLFQSPLGLKAQIQIFKQDSIFQNTKKTIQLGYLSNYNTRFYFGFQSTESSDIQNTNNSLISDFNNSYLTASLEYTKPDYNNPIFPKKTTIELTLATGKRDNNPSEKTQEKSNQFFINVQAMHNFYLNRKNCINIKTQNYYLKSNNYILNELYRFGGINSIRGFTENSLQAQFTTSILTEYRYIISPTLFLNTITDYCFYRDQLALENQNKNKNKNLIGLGLGMGVQTKNGLLRITMANGSEKSQEFKFYNTTINICYNVKF